MMGRRTSQPAFLAFAVVLFLCSGGCLHQSGETPDTPDPGVPVTWAGTWAGIVTEELHGPEGSFPPGCTIEQLMFLNLTQTGNVLNGTVKTVVSKVEGCDPIMSSSMVGIVQAISPVSGTICGKNATFSAFTPRVLGAADFTAQLGEFGMAGKVITCRSPDPRCTCRAPDPRCPGGVVNGVPQPGSLESINWWTGNFTLGRTSY